MITGVSMLQNVRNSYIWLEAPISHSALTSYADQGAESTPRYCLFKSVKQAAIVNSTFGQVTLKMRR